MELGPLRRTASVSSVGKHLDRYFSGPCKSLQPPKARSLEKNPSQNSMMFPRLGGTNIKIKTEEGPAERSRSCQSNSREMERKIKKEISLLRSGSTKKKLQLQPRGEPKPKIDAGNS
jgi:hypothetical protein